MRLLYAVALVIIFTASFSHGRNLASIRKDAFTVGVSKGDSAAEYDFISEITAKMKFSRFRLVAFENANAGQKLLLEGKIDAIIAKINYSPRLENSFLVSAPYSKTEIAVATLAKNSEIWSLADLNGKSLAFIPKDISGELIPEFWQNAKPVAVQNLSDAIIFLQKRQATAIVANRQTLEAQKDSVLRIFPNKLAENNIVALFAPNSQSLQDEFNKAIKNSQTSNNSQFSILNSQFKNKERIDKIIKLLNELKKEFELLQGELK
jgi:ABC-type amino acid transport substrate-binding protein